MTILESGPERPLNSEQMDSWFNGEPVIGDSGERLILCPPPRRTRGSQKHGKAVLSALPQDYAD